VRFICFSVFSYLTYSVVPMFLHHVVYVHYKCCCDDNDDMTMMSQFYTLALSVRPTLSQCLSDTTYFQAILIAALDSCLIFHFLSDFS